MIRTSWLLSALTLTAACAEAPPSPPARALKTTQDLAAHSEEFRQEVVEVAQGVHVAVGYGLANSILVSGDGCKIVVDTMESAETAQRVKSAFDAIDPSPLGALIYTHNHGDHVFGAGAFVNGEEVPVYAHKTTAFYLDRVLNVLRPSLATRSGRMFGSKLTAEELVNAGIGPFLDLNDASNLAPLRPTETFQDRLSVELCGLKLELVHAPGETRDQIFVWLPEQRILLPGDNLYRAFPNLYTIRGTPYRDPQAWIASLDAMRALRPEHLVPSHTRPLSGADEIYRVLTDYRDGIQFVHDQTIRGINQGLTPDELAATVHLPPHLAESPFLAEFYGTVAWSVRSIFEGNLGWFDGNPSHLAPHAPDERALRMAHLAGGPEALLEEARRAAGKEDWPWVLELTDHLLLLPVVAEAAQKGRIEALLALGQKDSNPNARHWYLTAAHELENDMNPALALQPDLAAVHATPLEAFFRSMALNLDPEASAEIDRKVLFLFPDSGKTASLHVRRGIAEVQFDALAQMAPEPAITVTVDSDLWKEILAQRRSLPVALAKGNLKVEGGRLELLKVLKLFQAS